MSKRTVKKEQSKAVKIFWKIFISLIGILLIFIAINEVALGIFGKTAIATVSTRRVGGSNNNEPPERQYDWSVDYSFMVDGNEYNGHTTHKGSAMSVNYDNQVHYYSFAPIINSIDANAIPSFGTFIMIGLGIFLLIIMNADPKKKKRIAIPSLNKTTKTVKAPSNENCEQAKDERVTMAWLMKNTTDYDDSVEEYYQNGWDINDPSWQCECGEWNEKEFCTKCGEHKK
ncbi:MAG: hypothetical protein A2Y17_04160 [Clostridiales bacterium GWF2_38_85]|nr:MAG: hypothetical protein A2Y17_04160 [Clostridiales bacterium GWF2_38_85]HBL83454.1 hypothetical protein [Clostridiales bacterium]